MSLPAIRSAIGSEKLSGGPAESPHLDGIYTLIGALYPSVTIRETKPRRGAGARPNAQVQRKHDHPGFGDTNPKRRNSNRTPPSASRGV
jgi:hypothetical protein